VWGHEQVVEVDDLRLRVVRSGSGSPLLLINGIGAPAEMWAPFATRLQGHELLAVDLPGTGASPAAAGLMRMDGIAGIVARVLDALGHRTVDVLGYSFGGIVAQELAWRAPHRVDRLVLCATSSGVNGVPPKLVPALLMLTPARYYNRSIAERVIPVIAGGRTRRDPLALQQNLVERLAKPPSTIGYLHQLYAVTGWTSARWLSRIAHATLIIHGDDDPLVPVVNARRMASTMPNARLTVIPGAGHLFLLDEPESVIPELVRFLRRPRAEGARP
jgi:poly(3-hydroxyoctanoate) depolymerase